MADCQMPDRQMSTKYFNEFTKIDLYIRDPGRLADKTALTC